MIGYVSDKNGLCCLSQDGRAQLSLGAGNNAPLRSLYGNLCRGASGVLLSASEKADGRRKALFQGTGNADGTDDSADWDRRTGQLSRLLGKQSADARAFGQSGGGGCPRFSAAGGQF